MLSRHFVLMSQRVSCAVAALSRQRAGTPTSQPARLPSTTIFSLEFRLGKP